MRKNLLSNIKTEKNSNQNSNENNSKRSKRIKSIVNDLYQNTDQIKFNVNQLKIRKNEMLRYKLFLLSISILLGIITNISFAQNPPSPANTAEPQRPRNPSFGNMTVPPGMITTVGRSINNSLDKGIIGTVMLIGREEIRNAIGITETQSKEIETIRTTTQSQAFTKIPELFKRFNNATEDDKKIIQNDLETYFQNHIDKINSVITPEQQTKMKQLVFQTTGGLNSPLISKDTLDVLNLTGEQREKAEIIIEQTKSERNEKIEELIKLNEKRIQQRFERKNKITKEEREAEKKEQETLLKELAAIGKKNGYRLKALLNNQQLQQSEELINNIPDFLPKSPFLFNNESPYIPNQDSWKPGQDVPESEKNKIKNKKNFPRKK